MNRIKSFFKHLRAARTLSCVAPNPQRLRLFVALAVCLVVCGVPADGALYIVASAALICFFFGVFRLFVRPLEGIMEICVGLIVFGIIGHALGWDAALTNVVVG